MKRVCESELQSESGSYDELVSVCMMQYQHDTATKYGSFYRL